MDKVKQEVIEKVTKNPVRAKVVSVSKDGTTAIVEVPTVVAHKMYGKRLRRLTSIHVHTARKEVNIGNEVNILPCRRMSKTKSWKVVEILNKG